MWVVTAEIFLFCTNLFLLPWLALQAIFSGVFVWLMAISSRCFQSCLILVKMRSTVAMQPKFFSRDLGNAFSWGGAHCPPSAPTHHTDPWGFGTRLVKPFPAPLESDPVQTMPKPPEMFWQWFAIPGAAGMPGTLSGQPLCHHSCEIWDLYITAMFYISKPLLFAKSWCRKRLTCTWPGFKPPPALLLCVQVSQRWLWHWVWLCVLKP